MTLVVVEVVEVEAVVADVAAVEVIKIREEVAKVAIKIAVEIITTRTIIVVAATKIEAGEVVIRMIDVVVMEEVEVDMVMAVMTIQKVNGDITIGEGMEETATGEKTNEVVISRAIIQAEVAMVVSSMAKERR